MGAFVSGLSLFLVIALLAAAFACWPILRTQKGTPRILLAGAATALVLGIGGGLYLILGAPSLAERAFVSSEQSDLPGLVAQLARRARSYTYDAQGWSLLGRGYLALGDANDAAAAFRRGAAVAPPDKRSDLLCAYGEALMASVQGTVTPEAEAAFNAALAFDPQSFRARYDEGFVRLSQHDNAQALAVWQSLLADAPKDAPWRGPLVDRIAALTGASGAAPDIHAMVEGLARRLDAHPDDAQGWQRLVRAYAVLGDTTKARAALSHARAALKDDAPALAALSSEAATLKLK